MSQIAKHEVICFYCKKRFDTNLFPFVKPTSNRYAHLECHNEAMAKKNEEDKAREDLYNYIMKLFNVDYVEPPVQKQIKQFMEQYQYTYSGILSTLKYAYEIKNINLEKANGRIGIVPYLYNEAKNYFYNIWLTNEQNKNVDKSNYTFTEVKIVIPPPERRPMKKLKFNFLDEEDFVDNGE